MPLSRSRRQRTSPVAAEASSKANQHTNCAPGSPMHCRAKCMLQPSTHTPTMPCRHCHAALTTWQRSGARARATLPPSCPPTRLLLQQCTHCIHSLAMATLGSYACTRAPAGQWRAAHICTRTHVCIRMHAQPTSASACKPPTHALPNTLGQPRYHTQRALVRHVGPAPACSSHHNGNREASQVPGSGLWQPSRHARQTCRRLRGITSA